MILDNDKIKNRAKARESARQAATKLVAHAGKIPAEARESFWDELRKMLPLPQTTATMPSVEAFSDQQSRAFGRRRMPWGKHQGVSVDEVPLAYLEKCCEEQEFTRNLKRYMASVRIAAEEEQRAQQGDEERF